MEFEILGPTTLYVDGQTVPLGAAKQRGLLALLLYHAGEPVRVDAIVDHLWEGPGREDCRRKLYEPVSRIRGSLRNVGLEGALIWLASRAAYRLDVDPDLVDYHRFRGLVGRARRATDRGAYPQTAALLGEALRLWKDEPLADLHGSLADDIRVHMEHEYLDAHKLLADCRLRLGRHDLVLIDLEQLLREHPFDEALALLRIRALCAANRTDEARTFTATFRARYRRAMKRDPGLDPPHVATGPRIAAGPPLQPTVAGTPPPQQLPPDIGDFVGHQHLLAELDRLTDPEHDGARVIAISGMPGVGKTTLAVHWGHRHRHRFPDGRVYLDASAYGPTPPLEPWEALGRILKAFGLPADQIPPDAEQRRDSLNRLLIDRRALLIIDNARDADQVRSLLPASDTCVILITSRTRLTSLSIREGARNITVEPLPDAASRSLLNCMVGTGRADTEPTAVQDLVRLCGGLPLALRIIGEHVAERPRARIVDLVGQLDHHLLTEHDEGETNLRTVFTWSYHLLERDAARLFRTAGLYPTPSINAAAVAAVCGLDPPRARLVLDGLARAHLVNHDTAGRYRFHDLLRAYAADRGRHEENPADVTTALRRLLDWYLISAANAAAVLAPYRRAVPDLPCSTGVEPETFTSRSPHDGPGESDTASGQSPAAAMAWCEAERANLVALGIWAARHGFPRHCWQIAAAVHEVFERYGRQDDMRELHEAALISSREDNHDVGRTVILCNLGAIYVVLRDYDRAADSFRAGAALSRSIGLVEGDVACSHNLASVYLRTGDAAQAIDMYTHVLAAFTGRGDLSGQASALCGLGQASHRLGDTGQAITYYHDALTRSQQARSARARAAAHGELATLHLSTGEHHLAATHARQALDLHTQARDETIQCDTLTTMADIERALGRYDDAVRTGGRALVLSDSLSDSYRRCRILTVLAETFTGVGDPSAASRARIEALQILDQLSDRDLAVRLLRDRLVS